MAFTKAPDQKNYYILLLTWMVIQLLLLWRNGIIITGEPVKYIHEASVFGSTGTVTSSNYWMYFTEILLITIANKLHTGFAFVVAVHLLLNLAATVVFYRYASTLFSPLVALAGTLLLLFNFPLQQFNTFLQTESVFYSLTIILSCYVLRLKTLTLRNGLIIAALLLLVAITRPTGLLFFPAVFLYLFSRFFRGIAIGWKLGIAAAAIAVFFFVLNMAAGSGGELNFALPNYDRHIICGVPTQPGTWVENGNSLAGLLDYMISHLGEFLKLAALRLTAFFGLLRSYYSPLHNIYLGVYFFSMYIAVMLSLRYWKRNYPYELLYCTAIIFMMCITAMLTCDDWHNRFYLTIHPYVNLLCLPLVARLLKKFT